MSRQTSGSATLDLLSQYNSYISERDKAIEEIEKKSDFDDKRLSYDDLFKENVKLKLQVTEYEAEISSLKKMIDLLKKNRNSVILEQTHGNTEEAELVHNEVVLPPRSANRKTNAKDLTIGIPNKTPKSSFESSIESVPKSSSSVDFTRSNDLKTDEPNQLRNLSSSSKVTTQSLERMPDTFFEEPGASTTTVDLLNTENDETLPFLNSKSQSNLSAKSNDIFGSPAASVTYTTSRITIKSPNKSLRSPLQDRSHFKSPQSANRITAVVNNQLHSPSKTLSEDTNLFARSSPHIINNMTSPSQERNATVSHKDLEFSPDAKAKLTTFSQLLDNSFGEDQNSPVTNGSIKDQHSATSLPYAPALPPPKFVNSNMSSPGSNQLGSPVILNKTRPMINLMESGSPLPLGLQSSPASTEPRHNGNGNGTIVVTKTLLWIVYLHLLKVHTTTIRPKFPSTIKFPIHTIQFGAKFTEINNRQRSPSTNTVRSTAQSFMSDIPLFVQPEEFGTIRVEVVSSLYQDNETEMESEDNSILISVIDRKSDKEMFKFAKSIQKIRELDVYLKSHVSTLSLPSLPERALFRTIVPSKVDTRREKLNDYFRSIFSVPEYPQNVSLKIAQFLSTDTAMNPVVLGDTSKEGTLIMRRPKKTLSNNTSWKVRYGMLNGAQLQLLDNGQLAETIRLRQATIELVPNIPEDKYGTKNGFLITEHKKNGLSASTKYFLCSETSKERELWVAALSEFTDTGSLSSANTSHSNAPTLKLNKPTESKNFFAKPEISQPPGFDDQVYVTDLSQVDGAHSHHSTITSNTGFDTTLSSSPREHGENNIEDDRELRRIKMRSLFPFKKLTTTSGSSGGDILESQEPGLKSPDKLASIFSSPVSKHPLNSANEPAVFGTSLEICLKLSSHTYQGVFEIPSVVYRCLEYLYKNMGIQEEGIFRLSGSSNLIKSVQEQFDREYDIDLCSYNVGGDEESFLGVNTVSGILKLYLRRLPHLIFGDEQFQIFKDITDNNHNNPEAIAIEFRNIIKGGRVPRANVSLMYSLFELLLRINENSKYNKMNLRNLCIVFSPTLNIPITMLQPFIEDFKCIFKGEEPISNDKRESLDIHIPGV
ncbi:hypothetical protein KAFR_0H02780 [Kazachstania africana CBS 2517]|uniref:Rho-GAP domain-containing protein n=1 Tax=Kazachstania africana (strain ATCC 22294 / BCRC 22015 / CBS 2517 / CECT 1963 / NBRC 1671 / NRRL Y-8276) TaxID=1071382 RepID=H2AZD1_KAZAF|nr:hypothetical protein KAFR_0H02780 [Kazachstania africana CBS 2517]CCF59687.1 hypothetical protein KAFR_0H02780 [Kazachstania africana CBS 2517]